MRAVMERVLDRRSVLAGGAALMGGAATSAQAAQSAVNRGFFKRTGLPIGIQLYTLGPDLAKDLDGTLAAVAATGFKTVETACGP
jgi:hypothetical protein